MLCEACTVVQQFVFPPTGHVSCCDHGVSKDSATRVACKVHPLKLVELEWYLALYLWHHAWGMHVQALFGMSGIHVGTSVPLVSLHSSNVFPLPSIVLVSEPCFVPGT